MLDKKEFIHDWLRSTDEEREALACTFKVSKDWKVSPLTTGWTTFLSVVAELAVQRFLVKRGSAFEIVDSGYIYQTTDAPVKMRNTCDLRLWSLSRHRFMNTEIKHTGKNIVDTFGTLCMPEYLVDKAELEGAEWLFVVDGLKHDSWGDCIDFSQANLIFYDIYTGEKTTVLKTKELAKYIKEVLAL